MIFKQDRIKEIKNHIKGDGLMGQIERKAG